MNKDVSVSISEVSNGFVLKRSVLHPESQDLDVSELFIANDLDELCSKVKGCFMQEDEE
jgi:hypothetical protein